MPAVQKTLIHLSQFTREIWLGFLHSHEQQPESLREAPKLCTPRHRESRTFPNSELSEPYSEQQGAPEAVQGQVTEEVLQQRRLQGKPQLLLQLDTKLSCSDDKGLGLFTTLNSILREVDKIQRQKSKLSLKSKKAHVCSCWWNTWKTVTELQYSILPTKPAQSQENTELIKFKQRLSQVTVQFLTPCDKLRCRGKKPNSPSYPRGWILTASISSFRF